MQYIKTCLFSHRPKDTISLEGQLDLSRPHNINCQNVQIGKIQRIRPTQNLQLEGKMELNCGDSIHHQILALPKKISKGQRPKDGISLGGDLDFSRHDSINFLALNQSIKGDYWRGQTFLQSTFWDMQIHLSNST